MRRKHKSDPVDPRPVMPRGADDFEEARIKRDFIAVFSVVSHAMFHSIQESHEYTYRAGFIAGKSGRGSDKAVTSYPSFIKIL